MKAALSVLMCSLAGLGPACADSERPQFRGPDCQGQALSAGVPMEWSESKNVRWKAPIPGRGWSSPVISNDQIWLTTATDDRRSLRAICVSRATGQLQHMWQKRIGGNYKSSPIAVGDHIYFSSQKGKMTVLTLGDEYSELATNQLDGIFLASPAVAGRSLFLRSDSHLYRIESP